VVDKLTPAERSAHMARIKRSNTKPELFVRGLLHRLGYRFRIQLKGVPGRPDVAFPGRRKAIFIHGCFWHAHENCSVSRVPKTRTEFWKAKFDRNRERDRRLERAAREAGWDCLTIWECEIGDERKVAKQLRACLGPPKQLPLPNTRRHALKRGR
jgi:DNA mismatch endonuclease, patch repair protein